MSLVGLNKLYTGSVKDLYEKDDSLIFHFSDRYSIYDWGQMPDLIESKGAALASMGRLLLTQIENPAFWSGWNFPSFLNEKSKNSLENSKTFARIRHAGQRTNFIAQLDDDLKPSDNGRNLQVRKVHVLRPQKTEQGYNYSAYQSKPTQTLIPLEVIFRLGLPSGSSFLKRARKNLDYVKSLGFAEIPKENDFFDFPMVEFSTKLEPGDRYLSYAEAKEISCLSDTEFNQLIETTQVIALRLYDLFHSMGLELWDGKFEFAWNNERELMLVDSIGLDELRVLLGKYHLSKEFLRQYYAGTKWQQQLDYYKSTFKENWKVQMLSDGLKPEPLNPNYRDLAKDMYLAFTNALANALGEKKVFAHAPTLRNWHDDLVQSSATSTKQNILIIGSGGREHTLAWKIAQSPNCQHVYVSPGNPGMKDNKVTTLNRSLAAENELLPFIKEKDISLVVIGPEAPLVEGLADILRKEGICVFGPSKEGALLEASKVFSKKIMAKANIPTAQYEEFTDPEQAFRFINSCNWQDGIVVKINGLASGKGVVVCNDKNEARKAIKELMIDNILDLSDTKVILEERLIGKEVSCFALVDGNSFKTIGHACDYKRIRDFDEGPNTGGMGTYSPADWLSPTENAQIEEQILTPLVGTLAQEKIDYRGVIFVGLMRTDRGMKVLEFNVRFGDPETQSLLPRIKSDFLELLNATATGKLANTAAVEFYDRSVVHIVAAAHGYPGTEGTPVQKGDLIHLEKEIEQLPETEGKVFFAGVGQGEKGLITSGGRVLGVSAFASTREEARQKAYQYIKHIRFEGMQYRGDIAKN